MGTAQTAVLRKTDAAVEWKLRGLDLTDRRRQKPTKFRSLFFGDGGLQILDFGLMLSHEDNQRDFGNTGDPGIADQLRVERKQAGSSG